MPPPRPDTSPSHFVFRSLALLLNDLLLVHSALLDCHITFRSTSLLRASSTSLSRTSFTSPRHHAATKTALRAIPVRCSRRRGRGLQTPFPPTNTTATTAPPIRPPFSFTTTTNPHCCEDASCRSRRRRRKFVDCIKVLYRCVLSRFRPICLCIPLSFASYASLFSYAFIALYRCVLPPFRRISPVFLSLCINVLYRSVAFKFAACISCILLALYSFFFFYAFIALCSPLLHRSTGSPLAQWTVCVATRDPPLLSQILFVVSSKFFCLLLSRLRYLAVLLHPTALVSQFSTPNHIVSKIHFVSIAA